LQFDERLRLSLKGVPFLTVATGFGGEGGAAVLQGPQPLADLPLLLVNEVPLLAHLLRLVIQHVPLLQQALELDLGLFQLRSGLLPDHRLPRDGWTVAIGRRVINLSASVWRPQSARFPPATIPRRGACDRGGGAGPLRVPRPMVRTTSMRAEGHFLPSSVGARTGRPRPRRSARDPTGGRGAASSRGTRSRNRLAAADGTRF